MSTTISGQPRRDKRADASREFMHLAVEYFVAGRSAALAGLVKVLGNLFHQSIEMFLKSKLAQSRESPDVKKLGHKLVPLWEEFKAEFPQEALGQFDNTIVAIDRFWELRYPDSIIERGAIVVSEWERSPSPTGIVPTSTTRPRKEPRYEVVIADVDRLVAKIFEVSSRNPKFFTAGLNAYGLDALTRNNAVAKNLGLEPVQNGH